MRFDGYNLQAVLKKVEPPYWKRGSLREMMLPCLLPLTTMRAVVLPSHSSTRNPLPRKSRPLRAVRSQVNRQIWGNRCQEIRLPSWLEGILACAFSLASLTSCPMCC